MVARANLKQLTDVPDGYDLSKAEAEEVRSTVTLRFKGAEKFQNEISTLSIYQ
jgi:hypothetical protein